MMKVLLIIERPRIEGLYLTKLQPLGVLYLASYLESKGISADVVDYNVEKMKKVGKRIDYRQYDFIGYSLNCANIENTLSSIAQMKKKYPRIPIVLGGPHARVIPKELMEAAPIDCLIPYEAEEIFFDYLMAKNKMSVKGLWLRQGKGHDKGRGKGKRVIFTGVAEPVSNLDMLPFPSFQKLPYKKYTVVVKKKKPVCAIITSRGCPNMCIFCHHSLGFKYRERSPENVLAEIKRLKNELGIREVWIADDNFTFNPKRIERLCDLLIKDKVNVSIALANGVRPTNLTESLLRKLKQAGCWFLTVAPESGNDESLIKIRKGFRLEDVERVVKLCKKLGIRTMANYIIGFPWEGEAELDKTVLFAKKLDTDMINVQRLYPYPGTPIWDLIMHKEYALKDEKTYLKDKRLRHPSLTEKQIQSFIKKTNHAFYTPKKILSIAGMLRPADFFRLIRYALTTRSM
ncbi:MAG: radical SAM protein [archaeon]